MLFHDKFSGCRELFISMDIGWVVTSAFQRFPLGLSGYVASYKLIYLFNFIGV